MMLDLSTKTDLLLILFVYVAGLFTGGMFMKMTTKIREEEKYNRLKRCFDWIKWKNRYLTYSGVPVETVSCYDAELEPSYPIGAVTNTTSRQDDWLHDLEMRSISAAMESESTLEWMESNRRKEIGRP